VLRGWLVVGSSMFFCASEFREMLHAEQNHIGEPESPLKLRTKYRGPSLRSG
jgi:hypothetical protein